MSKITNKPTVAIVGRPNVGKSTLFNRLIGMRMAIVEDKPGITRDRLHSVCDWNGREFVVVDTGGLESYLDEELYTSIEKQAHQAILEADIILFMLDGKEGVMPGDLEIAKLIRKMDKPVILAINKLDNLQQTQKAVEFFALGLGDPFPISALNGINTGDLLDMIVSLLPPIDSEKIQEISEVRVAIIGRPNVGKSSLVNKIVGVDRLVTSDMPGTTRDAVDVRFVFQDKQFVFVDTAGMRRSSRIKENIEYYSTLRARKAIDHSHITVLVLDAMEGVVEMDQKIAGYAHESGRGLIVAVNKWDLISLDYAQIQYYQREMMRRLSFCDYAPMVVISALTGRNLNALLQTIVDVHASQSYVVAEKDLKLLLRDLVTVIPLPQLRGQTARPVRLDQTGIIPPRFRLTVTNTKAVHFSYLRQVENRIRTIYPFSGTSVRIYTAPNK